MTMGKAGKPRGKMSSYAFFVQTCREEHKKKHPGEQVVFAEFSRKCSEKWKVRMVRSCPIEFITHHHYLLIYLQNCIKKATVKVALTRGHVFV